MEELGGRIMMKFVVTDRAQFNQGPTLAHDPFLPIKVVLAREQPKKFGRDATRVTVGENREVLTRHSLGLKRGR